MAVIPIVTIFQWCGMSTKTTRNRIIIDIISPPEGLKHLNSETYEEMLGTFWEYARHEKEDRDIIFNRFQQMRLILLMNWVKDKTRLEEEVSFTDVMTSQ